MTSKQYSTVLKLLTQLGDQVVLLRQDMNDGFAAVRKELRAEMAQGLAGVRQEIAENTAQLRKEMAQGFAEVRADLRKEMAENTAQLRKEMAEGFTEVKVDLRQEMAAGFARQEAYSQDILETMNTHFTFLKEEARNTQKGLQSFIIKKLKGI